MIPLFDPQPQHQVVASEVEAATQSVLASGQYILGPNVRAFEQEVADYHGVSDAVGVASGTDALHLALRAVGVGPGDEVITSPFSFIAAVEAIHYCGARPVFVDIHPDTMNLDESAITSVLTERTRAILPVHIFGLSANMERLSELAQEHNLSLVEDCAQAFGARFQNQPVGTFGDAGCFSSFPTKNLGGYGDGGFVITRDKAVAEQLRVLRNHGSSKRYYHDRLGFNSRLDELQAAALRVKLKHVDAFNQQRRRIAAIYAEGLAGLVRQGFEVQFPTEPEGYHHVYGQFTIQLENRDEVKDKLQAQEVGSAIYYPVPLHQQALSLASGESVSLPVCEAVSKRCLSLPIFPGMTDEQAAGVIQALAN